MTSPSPRSFVAERKKGVPEDYKRPIIYPVGDFEGVLMGDIVRVSDPVAAVDLERMGCFGIITGLRPVAISRVCFPDAARAAPEEEDLDVQPSTSTRKLNDIEINDVSPPSATSRQTWLNKFPAAPTLILSLEEAMFLNLTLSVLKVKDSQGNELSQEDFWKECRIRNAPNFVTRFAAYHYYRCKGWVVRSGQNFGVDFLLYKDGPEYHHSSYGVRILTDTDEIRSSHFGALNRVMSTVRKELIHCLVIVPTSSDFDASSPDCIRLLQIRELWSRTWMTDKNRD